jgi:hypothetical protein
MSKMFFIVSQRRKETCVMYGSSQDRNELRLLVYNVCLPCKMRGTLHGKE